MLKKTMAAAFIFACVMGMFTMSVNAYIDPSVITYIIQGVSVAVVAGGAAVAIYWKKIKLFFKRRKEKKNNPGQDQKPNL